MFGAGRKVTKVLYGNDDIGYFDAQTWHVVHDKTLHLSFVPPTYKAPVHVKVLTNQHEIIPLASYSLTSPLPAIFRRVNVAIVHGRLSQPFYLLNGALPRKILHNPSFRSLDPELFRRNHHRFTYLMIINRLGETVWIHVPVIGGSVFSSYMSVKRVGDGYYGVMFGKHSGYFEIVSHTGKVERDFSSKDAKVPFVMHHDFETIGAKKLYAVGNEVKDLFQYTKNPSHKGKAFVTDTIIGIDLLKRTSQKLLGFNHIFHPGNTPYITGDSPGDKKFVLWGKPKADIDFLHINSVDYMPDQGVLVSFRNISKVAMIDSKFRYILWTLGSDEKDDYSISSKAHQFRHQHTPYMLPDHRLVLFDNAIESGISRVVRYRLHKNEGRAELEWQYKPQPSLFAKDRSSVYELTNKNYGVFFVNPKVQKQKFSSIPHKDLYMEVDARTAKERVRVEITYPVVSPGYRMIPIQTISDDPLFELSRSWRAKHPPQTVRTQISSSK